MKFSTHKIAPLPRSERLRECNSCHRVLGNIHFDNKGKRRCKACRCLERRGQNELVQLRANLIRSIPLCQRCEVRPVFSIWDIDYQRPFNALTCEPIEEVLVDLSRLVAVCEKCLPQNEAWTPNYNIYSVVAKTAYWPELAKAIRQAIVATSKPLPMPEPTSSLPGSPEKIEELRQRASSRQELWHDDDADGPAKWKSGWNEPGFLRVPAESLGRTALQPVCSHRVGRCGVVFS